MNEPIKSPIVLTLDQRREAFGKKLDKLQAEYGMSLRIKSQFEIVTTLEEEAT